MRVCSSMWWVLLLVAAALACSGPTSARQPPRRLLQPRLQHHQLLTVPVAVTVVEPAAGQPRPYDRVSEAGIAQHIALLNGLFAAGQQGGSNRSADGGPFSTRFRFRVCRLRYVENDAWYRAALFSSAEVEAHVAARVGASATLNLFIKPLVNTSAGHSSSSSSNGNGSSSSDGPSINGHGTFPWWSDKRVRHAGSYAAAAHGSHGAGDQPEHRLLRTAGYDGVVLDGSTVPGATRRGGELLSPTPSVLAHEVGHWMGLLHTFEGTTRAAAAADGAAACTEGPSLLLPDGSKVLGDGCDDTPAHLAPSHDYRDWSCDAGQARDSCGNLRGADPINNVMNYVMDGCRQGFTACQDARMASAWRQWRAPGAVKPIARRDSFTGLPYNEPSVLPVFANDASAIPGNTFTLDSDDDVAWAVVVPPKHGTLSRTPSGDALVYTPHAGTAPGMADAFRYRAFDCHGESKLATVTLQLAAASQAAPESGSAASLVQQILLQHLQRER